MAYKKYVIAGGLLLAMAVVWDSAQASGIIQSAYNLVQDEGTPLARGTILNCAGAGITCATAANVTTMTVAGSSGGSSRGAFGSIPACGGGNSGAEYVTTNDGLDAQCNGTSWYYSYGMFHGVVPTTTSVSSIWFNQSSATVANTASGAGVVLTGTASAVANIQGRLQTVPATPYTYIACMSGWTEKTQFAETGVLWTDGTSIAAKVVTLSMTQQNNAPPSFFHDKYTSPVLFSGSYAITHAFGTPDTPRCFGLVDTGTVRKVAISYDRQYWYDFAGYAGESNTDFLTATHLGYYVNSNGSNQIPVIRLFSEEVVASALF